MNNIGNTAMGLSKKSFLFLFFSVHLACYASHGKPEVNLFELPGPLFSYGQFIIPKGWAYLSSVAYSIKGPQLDQTSLWLPNFTYGLRDDLAFTFYLPIGLKLKEFNGESRGLQDIALRLEYQLFKKEFCEGKARMTLLGSVFLPTGSNQVVPPTGFGSPGFFFGTTQAYLSEKWFYCFSEFALLTTKNRFTKFGNQIYYETAAGRNFYFIPNVLVTLFIELLGNFSQSDTLCDVINCNSGGNIIFLGPSILIGTENIFVQGGIAFPVVQQLNGIQPRASYFWGALAGVRL